LTLIGFGENALPAKVEAPGTIEALIPPVVFPAVLLPFACVLGPVEYCCADTEATVSDNVIPNASANTGTTLLLNDMLPLLVIDINKRGGKLEYKYGRLQL